MGDLQADMDRARAASLAMEEETEEEAEGTSVAAPAAQANTPAHRQGDMVEARMPGGTVRGEIFEVSDEDGAPVYSVQWESPVQGVMVGRYSGEELSALQPVAEHGSREDAEQATNDSALIPEELRRVLSTEEIEALMDAMEENAVEPENVPYTREEWDARFSAPIDTPAGKVRMGEHQFGKLHPDGNEQRQDRRGWIGHIYATLTSPSIIVEQPSPETGAEREYKYVFVKSFVNADGDAVTFFASVTVKKNDMEVVITNHFKKYKDVKNLLKKGKLCFSSVSPSGMQTEPNRSTASATTSEADINAGASASKDTPQSVSVQGNEQKYLQPIPTRKTKKGTEVLYHEVPVARTLEELYDGTLTQPEVDAFVEANVKESRKAAERIESTPPKMGTDLAAYKHAKAEWQAKVNEARRKADYWLEVQAEVKKITGRQNENASRFTEMPTSMSEAMDGAEYAAMAFTGKFGLRITPESFRDETGLGSAEQRQLTGVIATAENGGVSIEQAAEWLYTAQENDGVSFYADETEARDAIIDVLSQGNPKGYVARSRKEAAKRDSQAEAADKEAWAQQHFHMSFEEFQALEEQAIPAIIEQYRGFDEATYYANLADNYEQQNERRNDTEKDSAAESAGTGRSGELLQEERTPDVGGTRHIVDGQQGRPAAGDVQGSVPTEDAHGTPGGGRSENKENLAERKGDLGTSIKTSPTETDEDGSPFVLSSSGTTTFGEIKAETGLTPAPIKLSLGNSKYGLIHLERRHGEQIRNAGFKSVEEFVEYVCKNYKRIKQGENSVGEENGTYLLQIEDAHNNTLYIELSTDGRYWGVNSGGVFRKGYGNNKKEVWSASEEQNKQSVADSTLREEENPDIPTTPNGDVPTTSTGKSTAEVSNLQENGQKSVATAEEIRRQPLRERAKEWESKTGVKVHLIEDLSEVHNKAARAALEAGEEITGWYGRRTGEVYIYLPNVQNESDIDATYVHEVVDHKGMRSLLSAEGYDKLCDRVWNAMSEDARREYTNYPGVESIADEAKRRRAAADEYIAHLAEKVNLTDAEQTVWQQMVQFFREALEALGIDVKVSDAQLSELIRASYAKMAQERKTGAAASQETKTDVGEQDSFRFIGETGAANLDKAEEATTRLDNLGVAREMESAGKDSKSIKMATGWERGADGKWRYETEDNLVFDTLEEQRKKAWDTYNKLSDKYDRLQNSIPVRMPKGATEEQKQRIKDARKSLAKMRDEMNTARDAFYKLDGSNNTTLGEFLGGDNALFKEYPELKDMILSFARDPQMLNNDFRGAYDPENNSIWVDGSMNKEKIRSTLGHEIQHAIQHIEGFAKGGNESMFRDDERISELNERRAELEALIAQGETQYEEELQEVEMELFDLEEDAPYHQYRSLAGEVESRNVQKRMDYTPEQRRAELASETEDVAREDQIFIYDALESANSEIELMAERGSEAFARATEHTIDALKAAGVEVVEATDAMVEAVLEGRVMFSRLDKRAYEGRKEFAANRNAKNKEIGMANGLTEEQADLLEELTALRHELHTNQEFHFTGNSDILQRLVSLNSRMEEEGIAMPFIPTDESDYIDIDDVNVLMEIGDDVPESGTDEYAAWYADEFARVYDEIEDLNKDIEQFLGQIDEAYGTSYKPGGHTRAMFSRVYHGSGAKFDRFDHSFMGTGEGAQAFGWGTYVTEVEGIGRSYAESTSGNIFKTGFGDFYLKKIHEGMADGKSFEDVKQNLLDYHAHVYEQTGGDKDMFGGFISDYETLRSLKEEDLPKRNLYTVEIPEDNGLNYLNWYNGITDEQKAMIADAAQKDGVEFDFYGDKMNAKEYFANMGKGIEGHQFYGMLKRVLGSDKAASEFLNDMGYVGIKYPAQSLSGGNKDGASNYVIFNEADAKITDRVQFLRTADGTVYGWAVDGKVYLTKEGMNPNTPAHEYTHLWAQMVEKTDAKLWSRIVDGLRGSAVWNDVLADKAYEDIWNDENSMASEVLSRLTGAENYRREMARAQAEIADAKGALEKAEKISAWEQVKESLKAFLDKVKSLLGFEAKENGERLTENETDVPTWMEFVDMALGDLYGGVNPGNNGGRAELMASSKNEAPRLNRYATEEIFGGIWIDDKEEFAKFASAVANSTFEENGEGIVYTDNYFYAYYLNIDGQAIPYASVYLNAEDSQDVVNQVSQEISNDGTHERIKKYFDTAVARHEVLKSKNNANDGNNSSSSDRRGDVRLGDSLLQKGRYFDRPSLYVKAERADRFGLLDEDDIRYRVYGRNSGYTEREDGTAISNRAYDAEESGTFTAGTFRKRYKVSQSAFNVLEKLGIIEKTEWHHTGKTYKKSDFYSWGDSYRASSGDKDYSDANCPPGSFGDIYLQNKMDIDRLSKECEQKQWMFRDREVRRHVPQESTYVDDRFEDRWSGLLTEEEVEAKRAEHNEISNAGFALGSSFERRMMHEAVDDRYKRIAKSRFDESAVREEYQEKYAEIIKDNESVDERNKEIDRKNLATDGKETSMLAIAKMFNLDTDTAYSEVSATSSMERAKILHEKRTRKVELLRSKTKELVAAVEDKRKKWLDKKLKDGTIERQERVLTRPEFFITEKEEMHGRYGWFDASVRNNLPIYYSGIDLKTRRNQNHYNKYNEEISLLWEDFRKMTSNIYIEDDISERQGNGTLTDDAMAMENDPISKVLGKPRFTRKQRREFAERERQRMVARVESLAKKLHLDNVEVVTDASQLEGKKQRAKGFYSKSTGKITIVVPNHTSAFDVEQTLLHEAVAHYGLRQLFGEQFDTFLDNVYQSADRSIRERINALASKNGWNFRTATEEYLASLAEDTNFENRDAGWWGKIKSLFLEMLHKIGFEGFRGVTLTDNELRYILWRSYENLAEPGRYRSILGEAADVAMQHKLKVGNYAVAESVSEVAAEGQADNIKAVNARFNAELEAFTEENADSVVFDLGTPSVILQSAGVADKPMKLYGSKVAKKMRKHGFSASELRDLPQAIADPIAVFNNYNEDGNRSILTELRTEQGNFLVTLSVGKGQDVDFNIVSSVFGKGDNNIINWLNSGFATYINKEKALNYLHLATPIVAASDNQELVSAANVIETFENPQIPGVKNDEEEVLFRNGDPEIHERELARDRYERRVKTGMFQSQEALQDSMLGLKEAMQAILGKKTNIEDVDGFENAYLGENRLSSVNKAEADAFARLLFKPMLDEVAKLARNKAEREELTDYMMAKHGLERNAYMRNEAIKNGATDADQTDYAGLTALTGMDDVADAEAEAQRMVDDYEQAHETADLWEKVNAVSKAILQKSYECGMMSKETFDKVSDMYEFYIPLRGFDEKTSAEAYAYLSHKHSAFNAPIKKAEGRRSKADDPFANLQSMAEGAIMQGNRNKLVKQRFLNFALNHPSDLVSVSEVWYEEGADGAMDYRRVALCFPNSFASPPSLVSR